MRYISLTVEVWSAGAWQDCCSRDRGTTHFYADDKAGEEGEVRSPCPSTVPATPCSQVTTHSFGRLVAAERIRIKVSASLRWIGNDLKCFRFELLGCDGR